MSFLQTGDNNGSIAAYAVIGCVVLLVVAYLPTVSDLLWLWLGHGNTRYTHGLLLCVVCTYFVVKRWQLLQSRLILLLQYRDIALVASLSLCWLIAFVGLVRIAEQLILLCLLLSVFVALFGQHRGRLLATPVLLLIFAIPVWDYLNTILRLAVTPLVTLLLNVTGISSVQEDFLILVPAGSFVVDVQCSGLGQLIVALTIVSIYSYMARLTKVQVMMAMLLSILVAFAINMLRIYVVVVAGQLTDMRHYFVATEHDSLGWVLFAIGIFIFLYYLSRKYPLLSSIDDSVMPLVEQSSPQHSNVVKPLPRLAVLLFSIAIGPLLALLLLGEPASPSSVKFKLPDRLSQWQYVANSQNWVTQISTADVSAEASYTLRNKDVVQLNAYYYHWQRQGREAISDSNIPFDQQEWTIQSQQGKQISVEGVEFDVERLILHSQSGARRIVFRWYSVMGVATANRFVAKALNAYGSLTGRSEIGLIIVSIEQKHEISQSEQLLIDFIGASHQYINKF